MISTKTLLTALQKRVLLLEDDLRARCNAQPEVDAPLRKDYEAAREKGRTGLTYNAWRDEELTQIAVAWILAGVFVRFLEDNELIDVPFLAGGNAARHQRAQDEHSLFFRQHPTASERDYFEHVFNTIRKLPGMKDFFDRRHNPLWRVGPTADAAKALLEFWRKTDPDTGRIVHDFTDAEWNTRFLGDLYQDLSEFARKRYALLQTPVFVEQFILDRTLTPAISTFGYKAVRMIDLTCGSGHFLLGGFQRLFRLWQENEPGENPTVLARRALEQVFGVDLNPNVVAIARFRLLVAALRACGVTRIKDAPDFRLNLAAGDSLLHGSRFPMSESHEGVQQTFGGDELFRDELKHFYESEDREELHRILGQQYHVVVGNPPYITVKDKALNEAYRNRFDSCHRKYSLAAPFMERFFDLALKGDGKGQKPAGYVGMITANSFMKREFGKKLIEDFIPKWDLTHVIDTAGAYIPGHGTPTVILFGKHQPPVAQNIRTVMGIKGEPSTPDNPANGLVWNAILVQVDQPGSESDFVSVADTQRESFHKHPWSIGGGGAAELKEMFDESAEKTLEEVTEDAGFMAIISEDDAFIGPVAYFRRKNLPQRSFITGDSIRDWSVESEEAISFPYNDAKEQISVAPLASSDALAQSFWPNRVPLGARKMFGKTPVEHGLAWYQFIYLTPKRFLSSQYLVFASVGTHNQFSLMKRGNVLNRHAPVVVLDKKASDSEHYALLGLLNSSSACFWMKQIFHNKGSTVDQHGARQRTAAFEDFFEFDGTKLKQFPISAGKPLVLAQELNRLSHELKLQTPAVALVTFASHTRAALDAAKKRWTETLQRMIALQEELDWECYQLYGLTEAKLLLPTAQVPRLQLGERAFEIAMARKMASGELQTTWFERHEPQGSKPITELPAHWPQPYRELVQRRMALMESDRNLALIEQPEYKRRWNVEPWDEQLDRALREWLLNRLEHYFFGGERMLERGTGNAEADGLTAIRAHWPAGQQPVLVSTSQLAAVVETDDDFLRVAEIYRGSPGFSVSKLVRELVEAESVPFLPFQRYKDTGLRKRQDWEHVWDLQREEDRIDAEKERLQAKLNQRMAELVREAYPELVQATATAAATWENADRAYHAKYHSRTTYDTKHSEWVLSSTDAAEMNELLEVQSLGNALREAERKVTAARNPLADQDATAVALRHELEALQKPAVPVPPKYASSDFKKSHWWKLRGKLDVPKERWIIYSGAERDGDPSPVIAWAGWDHLQQAKALAGYYVDASTNLGWPPERLRLLLAGLADLLPWLKQWHNKFDPEVGSGLGDYFAGFLDEEARKQGATVEALNQMRFVAAIRQPQPFATTAPPKFDKKIDKTVPGKAEPVEAPEFALFAEAYPSNAADRLVCALALEIVTWRDSVDSNDHLDALILATHPDLCQILMAKGSASQLDSWTAPITSELKVVQAEGLKWVQCVDYLEKHLNALVIGRHELGHPIRAGLNFYSTRQSFACEHSGIAIFALSLLDSIKERRQDGSLLTEQTKAIETIEKLHTQYAMT